MQKKYDFVVVGSGIAGMSFALKVAHKGSVALLCKTELTEANTMLAQGGISSVTNYILDNYEKHIEDTLIAGDGICDRRAVEKVVTNAPEQIKQLLEWGVDFDKTPDGSFDLHKEGGHSEFRILHHKDSTGAEIQYRRIRALFRRRTAYPTPSGKTCYPTCSQYRMFRGLCTRYEQWQDRYRLG